MMKICAILATVSLCNEVAFSFTSLPAINRRLNNKTSSTSIRMEDSGIPQQYPIARKNLIKKAREIDAQLKEKKTGSYSNVGWSNRLGTVLTPVVEGGGSSVYAACRPFLWNRIDVGCKMTVVELSTKSKNSSKPDLFVHSPVQLDRSLMEGIDKLGTVKHVVSPNYEHIKYAKEWQDAYPDALMWACPGLMEREKNVKWTGEIPYSARPPTYPNGSIEKPEEMWDWDEIAPLHFDVEKNPFTGRPFFNEVVFYHKNTKTLMTTDTYWNYPNSDGITNSNYKDKEEFEESESGPWDLAPSVPSIPLGSSLWKKGMDKLFRPFYLNLMVQKDSKREFLNIAAFISGLSKDGWEVDVLIPAHGDCVRGTKLIKSVLKDHFNL
eukprot:419327_1